MGLFDTLCDDCPHCLKFVQIQTKIGECSMLSVTKGQVFGVPSDFPNILILQTKNPCEHCTRSVNALFYKGKFLGFTQDDAEYEERQWGEIFKREVSE